MVWINSGEVPREILESRETLERTAGEILKKLLEKIKEILEKSDVNVEESGKNLLESRRLTVLMWYQLLKF